MTAVSVTAAHIAAGEARHCERSAEALAIMDAFRPHGFVFASVDRDVITAGRDHDNPDSWITVTTPDVLAAFIDALDDGRPVEPITFDLDLGVLDLARLA